MKNQKKKRENFKIVILNKDCYNSYTQIYLRNQATAMTN